VWRVWRWGGEEAERRVKERRAVVVIKERMVVIRQLERGRW
jgi:hypothetical protein